MELLGLDDPRWIALEHRTGEPAFVPRELAKLVADPRRLDVFHDLWPSLCCEGQAWPAAFAVVPYAVELAGRVPLEERFEYLLFIGLVRVCTSESTVIEPWLLPDYLEALPRARTLLIETLHLPRDRTEMRYALATLAALSGHLQLAEVLQDIDTVHGVCEQCGTDVYPDELQAII